MVILQELLGPLTLNDFYENYLFKLPFAAPSAASRFKELISWPLLKEIFEKGHADCWLPQHGLLPEQKDLQTGRLTYEQARKGFEAGRTVLVRHAEKAHPRLEAIAKDFYELFKDPVDIQLYCTPAGEEGFDWHYDSEEVFVIQSAGEKEFRLRKNTVNPWPVHSKLPKNMHFEKEAPAPEIRCLLKAGDWLYIPAGYWHKARAVTESYHLSVGVMSLTAVGFLESLLPKLIENPLWRQRLPPPQAEGREESLDEMFKLLSNHLSFVMRDEAKKVGQTEK